MVKRGVKTPISPRKSNPVFWEKLKRQTLIESTGSSLRLAGVNVTNEEVEQIVHQSMIQSVFKEDVEKILSPKQLAVWQYLQTVNEATPGDIAKNVDIARPTVNQALDKLLRLKKVERIGLGRATRYKKL